MRVLLLLGTAALLVATSAWAGDEVERPPVSLVVGGERVAKRVRSFKELRQEGVVIQRLDYSCGAAAMATVLSAFFGDTVTEDEVIGFIFIHGQTPEEGLKRYFRRKGFSLLDLKRYAEFRGYRAAGYKEMVLEDLVEILRDQQVPVLVSISPFGYDHFVVVQGIQGNRIYLADPALGKITYPLGRFVDMWVDGIGFVVSRRNVARSTPPVGDDALARITAAGDGTRPARSAGTSVTVAPRSALLETGFAVPDMVGLQPVFARRAPAAYPSALPVITDVDGRPIMSIFPLRGYNPAIGFGRPEGNFIDFSPPPGEKVSIQPSEQ